VLLVITGSGDATADYLFERLGEKAFRLNYDLFSDYTFQFAPSRWHIENPTGFFISSDIATSCFWWKPFNFTLEQESYVTEEVKYTLRELYNWLRLRGMTKGNSGVFHQELGKLNIISIASRNFKVPDSLVVWGPRASRHINLSNAVAKSLASGLTTTNRALYTTAVDPSMLDLRYPWFLQERVDADFDLTFQYVGDKIFGFSRSRKDMKTLDWRKEIFTPEMDRTTWKSIPISDSLRLALKNFAADLGIQWGRVDMIGSLEDPHFLEFNANGQWLFLDPHNEVGLVDAVVEYLCVAPEQK
jgi:hypothetical protein